MEIKAPISLESRAVLAVSGEEATAFLQGVVTQDMELLAENKPLYGAHLTPQGRFLYDFFLIKHPSGKILIECNKEELMPLAGSLHKYAVGQKIEFEDLSEDYVVLADILEKGEAGTWQGESFIYTDPRLKELGLRALVPAKGTPTNTHAEEVYEAHRISMCVPDGSKDGFKSKTLPNELRLESLNGINFEKGCYVGQELTARTKFRSAPQKSLYVITFPPTLSPELGTPILAGENEAGWVFSSHDGKGIALLRNRLTENKSELTLNGEKINFKKPSWIKEDD